MCAQADATARAAVGRPIAAASSPYERVSPRGTARSASHTRRWNVVARRSSGIDDRSTASASERAMRSVHFASAAGAFSMIASGYSRLRPASSVRSESPSVTAQTPRSVAPTRRRPSGVATVAKRTWRPLPPRAYAAGVVPRWRGAFAYARLDEP